jgi:hypothetical protein
LAFAEVFAPAKITVDATSAAIAAKLIFLRI